MTAPSTRVVPVEAIKSLTEHQEQLDMDGCMVGVSRQALDETLAYVAALNAAPAPTAGGGEDVWARVSEKARTYARCYPEASDGRNTFILFSEWAEQQAALQSSPAPSGEAVLWQAFIVGGVAMPLVWLDKAKADEWLFEYGEMENLSLGIRPLYAAPVSAPAGDDELRRAKEELSAMLGYLRNAKIDLQSGAPKATAIRTIEGGLKRGERFLADLGGA